TGESGLIVASRLGHEGLVNLLCEVVDDVDDSDDDGWTALLNACSHGHLGVVRSLVEHGAEVHLADLMGWTPLMWAVYKNHPEIVAFLLEKGAHANLVDEEDGLTPLMAAAGRGYDQVASILIAAGAEVNATDKFGNTPLIWAARKGYLPIVRDLLNAGVELDTIGMHSSTALMLATRGNFLDVVELIISREPNLNIIDNNGCTALSIASREGYGEIAAALLEAGAYVNVVDKFGDPLIINAVRSGNVSIVRELLVKYADVNAKDLEGRTAMHLAIDKGYIDVVLTLLERKPNLEQRNRDGETPLFRAVKSRNTALTQLLVHSGAKVAATDKNGDNCLHLALRARSRHLTQTLLSRPNDARLLYRPNKVGETPYSIDQNSSEPILPFIFGPAESHAQPDSMLGYDVYSNVLADILSEPNLSLPLTVGLYAKWGSGKSFLLNKMKASMQYFSRSWLETASLYWSWKIAFLLVVFGALCALLLVTATSALGYGVHMIVSLVLGSLFIVALLAFYAFIYYGSEVRGWQRCVKIANTLGRQLAHLQLFFNVIFYHPPILRDKDLLACPVAFLFADYHRLSSIGGEQALAKIVTTLFEACESHYGMLSTRLFCALKTSYARGSGSKMRRVCGLPVLMVAGISIGAIMLALVLLSVFWSTQSETSEHSAIEGTLFTALVLLLTVLLVAAYPLGLVLVYGTSNAAKRRINKAAHSLQTDRFEGFMQRIQQEVDVLADLVHCLDSFTQSQTRLVVVVDGLDNCERDKMVQTLDALELLFSSRQNRPFVVTIAVDPHIIISAVTHNIHSALTGTDLTGYDYLKNIVSMPFYLHNSALRQLQMNLRKQQKTLTQWKDRFARQETFHGSYISLNETDKKPARKGTVSNSGVVDTSTVSNTLLTDDYFSNLNPRSMKRIVNTLTLSGRLMRSFEVDFSWLMLGHWVSLIEQWPYRMSWMIDYCDQVPDLPD
uniref:KAP NTPase domain-containing protein n=1 Tax=Plectus sambesii TaxID=2011161 RepID=A0A914XLM8_9BILA